MSRSWLGCCWAQPSSGFSSCSFFYIRGGLVNKQQQKPNVGAFYKGQGNDIFQERARKIVFRVLKELEGEGHRCEGTTVKVRGVAGGVVQRGRSSAGEDEGIIWIIEAKDEGSNFVEKVRWLFPAG